MLISFELGFEFPDNKEPTPSPSPTQGVEIPDTDDLMWVITTTIISIRSISRGSREKKLSRAHQVS
jgi:hypothetical protein